MDGRTIDQHDYVRRLLEAYRVTPGTSGAVRRPDRVLARSSCTSVVYRWQRSRTRSSWLQYDA